MSTFPDFDEEVDKLRLNQALNALDALQNIGEDLAGEASRRAPIEEGTLRGSFAVTLLVNGQRFEGASALATAKARAKAYVLAGAELNLEVEVSANTVYAARQHEELEWDHPLGGEAKYLERPFLERLGRYRATLARAAELRGRLT